LKREAGPVKEKLVYNTATYLLFKSMGLRFTFDRGFRKLIKNEHGSFDRTIAFQTRDGSVRVYAVFEDGKMKVKNGMPPRADVTLVFRDTSVVKELAGASPEDILGYLLTNRIVLRGNLSYLMKFAHILNCFAASVGDRKARAASTSVFHRIYEEGACGSAKAPPSPRGRLEAPAADGVRHLGEPYLRRTSLEDFPGLRAQRAVVFSLKPAICVERARLLTEHFMERGFEHDRQGRRRVPVLRQAEALSAVLAGKAPLIHDGCLLAGSTTARRIGVVLYPEGHALTLWPELRTIRSRPLMPYDITDEEMELLDQKIFPYWCDRNVRECARITNNFPRYQELDERFVLYFMWKTVALSHTVPDFPRVLAGGLEPIIARAQAMERASDEGRAVFYRATRIALEGVLAYARNLRAEALRREGEARREGRDPSRFSRMAAMLERVPARGARSLDEAFQSLWVMWIALHNESTNAGLSLGRLDAWLQPYFEADMAALGPGGREEGIRRAIELAGSFMLCCQDHLPLIANVGNKLFGGSSSDQALTLGGVDREGRSAVCDMTYVFLKATEMLTLRDPNMNARFCPGVNDDAYLRRLIEVNMLTGATPSIHNDGSMVRSLKANGFAEEDARDWCATGCVEPTIPGRHFGHTNCMMFNMVAALEMALHDGVHPLMEEQVGPRTGDIRRGAFPAFDDFYRAFERQLQFLALQSTECNNSLGRAHQEIRPTPTLSALFDGPMEKARDLTEGSATYNTSGVACIGLTDIIDSLMTVKTIVYDRKTVGFPELLDALEADFVGHEKLHAVITNQVPKFGSDDPEVNAMAARVVDMVYDTFHRRTNYRGGPYLAGFWSMSNHVAFGNVTGAVPSGRRALRPFTPGLTPENVKDVDLLSSIRAVAALNPEKMPNNIAFNVKIAPDSRGGFEATVDQVTACTKAYFELGGMQIQFNMVTTETLKDAMEHPENHRNLMVRISGYNVYFIELNREVQLEVIERQQMKV
jgi:pyruvate formate-lyase/glycerol dehydratase family glycyl radical enzyme